MAELETAGYWNRNYWPGSYWHPDYWGVIVVVVTELETPGYWNPDYWAGSYWNSDYWGVSAAVSIAAPGPVDRSELALILEYGSPPMAKRRRRGVGGLRADVLEAQRKRLEAIFDDEELITELLDV